MSDFVVVVQPVKPDSLSTSISTSLSAEILAIRIEGAIKYLYAHKYSIRVDQNTLYLTEIERSKI